MADDENSKLAKEENIGCTDFPRRKSSRRGADAQLRALPLLESGDRYMRVYGCDGIERWRYTVWTSAELPEYTVVYICTMPIGPYLLAS